jgi:hypothetical protein
MGCADSCKKASEHAGVNVADNFTCKPNCSYDAFIGTKDPCKGDGGCSKDKVADFSKLTVPWDKYGVFNPLGISEDHWTLKCNDGIWKTIYHPDKYKGNNTYGCVLPDSPPPVKQHGPAPLPKIKRNSMILVWEVLAGVGLIVAAVLSAFFFLKKHTRQTRMSAL